MTFVDPNDLEAQAREAARFQQLVDAQLQTVADKTADRLTADQPVVAASMVDLALLTIIGAEWETVVAGELLPVVEQMYTGASVAWTLAVAGTLPGWATADVPPVSNQMAADYLAGARNRLVGIGDDLWANTRTSLLAGFEAGEDIPTLASRVRDAAGVTTPRANSIARTEVVGASNRGSFDTARQLGIPMDKVWMSTPDDRTRPSHVEADQQQVPLEKPFTVGGASLEHPGDWLGPPEEVIECRCVIGYEIPEDTPPPGTSAALVAAGEDTTTMPCGPCNSNPLTAAAHDHDGAMIALVPTEADAARLALDGGEPAEELHLTLAYLGPGADWTPENREVLHNALASYDWDAPDGTIAGNAFGAAHWNPTSDSPAWVLNIGGDALPDLHAAVGTQLERARGEDPTMPEIPAQHKPWAAHLCVTYDADTGLLGEMERRLGEITFDRLRIAFAGEATDIPLAGGDLAAAAASPAAAATTDFQEEGEPEPGAPPGPPCPPGQHRMPDGTCMDDEEMPGMAEVPPPAPVPGAEHFHTVVTEGVSTGMRRFEEGALTWRTPPFAFHWEYSSAAHGGQMLVAQVGLVTRVVRDGNDIHFYGPLDLDSERGMEYARQLAAGYARWSSVGLDEEAVEVEFVWPEGEDPDDAEDPFELLFAEPEEMIIKSGNIGEVTAVSVPALADATVEPTQALLDALADRGVTVASAGAAAFGAVAPHSTATTDEEWDADAARDRLPSPLTVDQARAAFAWYDDSRVEDGELPKDAATFIHHEVGADGSIGAANLTACSNTIAVLNGGRGVDTSDQPWSGDREGIWEHVARHLRDADREPPPLQTVSGGQTTLVAASHTITIPDVPPAHWFDEPTDVTPLGALTITDEGRVYGYLAPAGIAHRAYRDRRVTAPMGKVDYGRWMGGEALVAGGRVVAGPITMECGHMSPYASPDAGTRMDHYHNTCSVFAKARVGENRHGVWVAGALEPGVSPDQLSRALACRLSGDWAPHPERPGWQEFVAALLVPVPGFPQARSGPSVTVKEGALVASAVPVRLAGPPVAGPDTRPVLERLARQIGRDRGSRMKALRARVHNKQEVHDGVV